MKKGFFERRKEAKDEQLADKKAQEEQAKAAKAAQKEAREAQKQAKLAEQEEQQRARAEAQQKQRQAKQAPSETDEEAPKRGGFFSRLKQGLNKTSSNFAEGLGTLLLGKKEIDDELLEDLETQLIAADVGIEATLQIVENLTRRVSRSELLDAESLYAALQGELEDILAPSEVPLVIDESFKPFVIFSGWRQRRW